MNALSHAALTVKALSAILATLRDLLQDANMRSGEAYEHIQRAERNAAIGSLAGFEVMLNDIEALYGAALALHRAKPPLKTAPSHHLDAPWAEEGVEPVSTPLTDAQPSATTVNPMSATAVTMAEFRNLLPDFEVCNTGVDRFALRHDCDAGGYILITECNKDQVPPDDAEEVDVARYAANGGVIEVTRSIRVSQLSAWIEAALGHARHPNNIADYFAKRLGASAEDYSLRGLPSDSECGQLCVKAIDAAASFGTHVHAVFGIGIPLHKVVHLARGVVATYWHGRGH